MKLFRLAAPVYMFNIRLLILIVKYGFSLLLRHDKSSLLAATATGDLDLLTAMEATYDILLLETVHKLMVCVFETLCTHRGTRRSAGGATPGKLIMGIRIYHFSQVSHKQS